MTLMQLRLPRRSEILTTGLLPISTFQDCNRFRKPSMTMLQGSLLLPRLMPLLHHGRWTGRKFPTFPTLFDLTANFFLVQAYPLDRFLGHRISPVDVDLRHENS
jgi:hypothetical protein